MLKTKLTLREIELINLSYSVMRLPINYVVENDYVIFYNNELQNLDIMFNCILDTFVKIGLCDKDEPNELGLELETLNEKINHVYVRLQMKKD